MHEEILRKIGLTDGETKVYLALLESGPSTVGPIVKKSGVAYSNIYEVLQRLAEKGLVSYVIKQKTKHFQAYDPEKLMDYIKRQESEIEKEKAELNKILPALKKISEEAGEKLEAEVYVGMKGVFSAFEKMEKDYKSGEDYFFLYNHEPGIMGMTDNFFTKLDPVNRKVGLKMKGISQPDYRKSKFVRYVRKYLEMRYIDIPLPANVDMHKDKLLFVSWSAKPVAFIIHSVDMAEKFRAYFNELWKIAKP